MRIPEDPSLCLFPRTFLQGSRPLGFLLKLNLRSVESFSTKWNFLPSIPCQVVWFLYTLGLMSADGELEMMSCSESSWMAYAVRKLGSSTALMCHSHKQTWYLPENFIPRSPVLHRLILTDRRGLLWSKWGVCWELLGGPAPGGRASSLLGVEPGLALRLSPEGCVSSPRI